MIKDFYGNYTRYKEQKVCIEKGNRLRAKADKPKNTQSPSQTSSSKMTYKERKEFEALEASINELEREKIELNDILSSPAEYAENIETISKRYSALCEELNQQCNRWLELSEKE